MRSQTVAIAAMASTAAAASPVMLLPREFHAFVPAAARQVSAGQYTCHEACGNAILEGTGDHCENESWIARYDACMECALDYNIWQWYEEGVTEAAAVCGLDAVPDPADSTSAASSATATATSTTAEPTSTEATTTEATTTEATTEATTATTEEAEETTAEATTTEATTTEATVSTYSTSITSDVYTTSTTIIDYPETSVYPDTTTYPETTISTTFVQTTPSVYPTSSFYPTTQASVYPNSTTTSVYPTIVPAAAGALERNSALALGVAAVAAIFGAIQY